ncbi:MAG: hypothetical protein HYY13_08610 [Nitrospirae bacterium]|nr:hypothetical protein [Nitrospirota bacterium]
MTRAELPGRLARLDSPASAEAWQDLAPVLARYGLDVRPETRALLAEPRATARILGAVAQECAGVASALWADYAAWLPFLLAGAEGVCESDGGGCPGSVGYMAGGTLRLAREADGWRLSGRIGLAFGASASRELTVYAESESEGAFVRIAMNGAGEPEDNLGLRACRLRPGLEVDHTVVGPKILVQSLDGARVLRRRCESIALGWLATIAAANGRAALRGAQAYAGERYQGGGLLAQNPVIRHLLGSAEMRVEAAACLAEHALEQTESGKLPTLAKVFATQMGEQVCLDAIQCLGGYGYMRDYGLEKRARDAKTLCTLAGSNVHLLAEAGGSAEEVAPRG